MQFIVRLIIFSFVMMSSLAAAENLHIYADYKAMPKNWQAEDGSAKGIQVEILEEISRRTGIKFTYSFAPWNRVYAQSEDGRGGIIGFSKTSARQKHWDYSDPLYFDELTFVTIKEKEFEFSGLASLKGMRIAIKRGASYGDDFETAIKQGVFKTIETANRTGQMQMLTRDRVDAVLLSPGEIALEGVIAENDWLQNHRDDFVLITPPYKLDPNYLGIPKSMNKSHLLEPINAALKEIFADGTHKKIVERVTKEAVSLIRKK